MLLENNPVLRCCCILRDNKDLTINPVSLAIEKKNFDLEIVDSNISLKGFFFLRHRLVTQPLDYVL